ncbi:MAG: LacI family DNA-binding transcriptional regulator [Anaerolineales bacterium]|nr:LacI family DNA-binding transcriptional regulator [Anaerolineales bacterium]
MSQPKKAVTIHDVARAAGVSVSTVSRVLNDKDDVAQTTYSRVQTVISELGYASSLAAKSMRSHQTNVIGLIMPDLEESFPLEVMKGVNQAILDLNYDLIVYTNGDINKNTSAEKESQYVSLLNNNLTDGVIIVTPAATTFSTNSPVVAVDPNNETPNCPAIIATNRNGALSAMDYLLQLGHRRIGYIGGRSDLQSAIRRQQGYLDGLAQAGIPAEPELMQEGDFTMESGYRCGQQLLALAERPTAVFAANDRMAFGVAKAAQEIGLNIPDDLSLVGFDDIPEAAYYLPGGLTTVDQSIRQMGLIATEMLVKLIRGEGLESIITKMPTRLIVRGSCRSLL